MGREKLIRSSSLPLDVFRDQIRQFKRSGVIPPLDDTFEKDAVLSALKRIDPSLSQQDANLHADIIIHEHNMTSPEVTGEDIQHALTAMYARHKTLTYQIRYAFKYLRLGVFSRKHFSLSTHIGRFIASCLHGKFSQSFGGTSSYTSLLHRI